MPALALDHHRHEIVGVVVGERRRQRRAGLRAHEAPLHHVARLRHEIEVDVPLLGDAVAAMAQLDRVDRLGDQQRRTPAATATATMTGTMIS